MKYHFEVPNTKKIRVIIDTDAKNEADDQYAIIHALLTPKFLIKGMIAAHFGEEKSKSSMLDSYNEMVKLLSIIKKDSNDLVFKGSTERIKNPNKLPRSEGSELIIREAMKEDSIPLFCAFLGPLTDMAIALLNEPKIKEKVTVIWIGGGKWPNGGWEYNLSNDIQSANIVFQSGVRIWQIPRNVYSRIRISLAELQIKVRPFGKIGKYLFTQLIEVNNKYSHNTSWPVGESWCLGDSAAIGVLMDDQEFLYTEINAPFINEEMKYKKNPIKSNIRIYENIDSRFILEDFFAKLAIFSK